MASLNNFGWGGCQCGLLGGIRDCFQQLIVLIGTIPDADIGEMFGEIGSHRQAHYSETDETNFGLGGSRARSSSGRP